MTYCFCFWNQETKKQRNKKQDLILISGQTFIVEHKVIYFILMKLFLKKQGFVWEIR